MHPGAFDFFFFLMYLFLGVLGLRYCTRAFSSCQLQRAGAILRWGARASHCGGFSCLGARALGAWAQQLRLAGSRAQAHQLWRTGLVAPRHAGSSRHRGSNPCSLHWQADSQPLRHQGSLCLAFPNCRFLFTLIPQIYCLLQLHPLTF